MVGDLVYFNISTIYWVMSFFQKEKLSPRYVGPYEVVKDIVGVANE